MSDVVHELKQWRDHEYADGELTWGAGWRVPHGILTRAACEIERLRAEIERLRGLCRGATLRVLVAAGEIERLGDMVEDARLVIERGVDLMTHEQLGHWEGVRTWLEMEDGGER